MISDMFLQELKSATDIVQIVSAYVHLKRSARIYTGLCPFHSEKSPSFTVYPDSQSFYCFGCGTGGDVISFIRNIENMGYVEAVQMLAERAGMNMPEFDDKDAKKKARILELNRTLARYYHECLKKPMGRDALDYLHKRGIANQTIVRFGLGWAPQDWNATQNYLYSAGYTKQELLDAAVAAVGQKGSMYDVFRGRVIFPIIDLRGRVIGFGGRILKDGDGPKYLNSSDTLVFKKSRNLFAFQIAKSSKKEELLLCEGYMDVIAMHQAGFQNAVASLGTALTPEQTRLIAQYVQSVVLAYDSDGPGQAATRRAMELFSAVGVKTRVLSITGAKDPDEYIHKFGTERFALLLNGASNALDYEIKKLHDKHDVQVAEEKVAFLKDFVKLMLGVTNAVEREVYVSKAATELEIDKNVLITQIKNEQKRQRAYGKDRENELRVYSEAKKPNQAIDYERMRNIRFALAEDKLIAILLKNPDFYPDAAARIKPEQFVTQRNRDLAAIVFERLEHGQDVSLSALNSQCSVEQMSSLTGYLTSITGMMFSQQDLADYIDTILSFGTQKTKNEIATMHDDELQAYIASLAAGKK